ncbi:MAG: hypothetical protein COB62_03300 [Piscirickettsiaceae bacterium]|nr:MAG: hypothetical protein COB62_03300 [Piscirickettsiaceae bacterium]
MDIENPPGLIRRLAVMLYDGLLIIALFFVATIALLPFNQGEAFQPNSLAYSIYLLVVSFLFYGWFWTHGGQTLGLIAWKMHIVSESGQAITWKQALIRFFVAIFSWGILGLGLFWALFNSKKLTWHDIASKSHLEWKTPN